MSEEFILEERILCEDDTCIGLIGPDGLCKVCGRVYQGPLPLPHASREASAVDGQLSDSADFSGIGEGVDSPVETTGTDLDERIPCVDDLCIGVIGPDGKCGTCGKSAS